VPETIYDKMLRVRNEKGAGFIVLIDPDKLAPEHLPAFAEMCARAGVDFLFVGGSLMHATELEAYIRRIKEVSDLPVIGFPGSLTQICPSLDAVLYLSVISGRNPEYLIGQHVMGAPIIRRLKIEPISTGYMLVESGSLTTALYMNHSLPLPRKKPDVAAATALAAEMMGMRLLYTDGGSGAEQSVPEPMIEAITETCTIPLIVGGGLSSPIEVQRKVESGAGFIVVGNAIERRPDLSFITELAAAAHVAVPRSY